MGITRSSKILDAVIVGAGPAGGMTGYYLSREGLKTLIIDKKRFPRYKACGGGLTKRTLDILPFDIHDVIEDYAYTAKISIAKRIITSKKTSFPLIGMVMRDRFDDYLIQQAKIQGALFEDNTALLSVSGTRGELNIETTNGKLRAKMIIGADGVHSNVARTLNLHGNKRFMTAIEAEVFLTDTHDDTVFKHTVHFDFGIVPNGYGWVFPKKNHLSIGVMTVSNKALEMKRCFENYLATKVPVSGVDVRFYKAHLIPHQPDWNNRYANEMGLLVGDAAGITDPVTGEGIFYAVREAQLAAKIIKDHLLFQKPLMDYDTLLKKEMIKEVTCAQRFAYLLYQMPQISYRILMAHGNRIAKNHIKIITGEKSYVHLHKEVFSLSGVRTLLFAKDY